MSDKQQQGFRESTITALRDELISIAQSPGDYETAVGELTVHRRDRPYDPIPCIYDLGLAITVSGRKRVCVGQDVFVNGPGQGLLASVDLPVASGVSLASQSEPYLGAMLRFDSALVLKVAAGRFPERPSEAASVGYPRGTLIKTCWRPSFVCST